jgi:hypothetical protein
MSTNMELIGRDEINDLEAILSVSNSDSGSVDHRVDSRYDTLFTWDYDKGTRARLDRLYEKAKTAQWNGTTDLPWEIEVDQEAVVAANRELMGANGLDIDVTGTPFERWSDAQWLELGCESQNWMLSQFLHGEQGALLCTPSTTPPPRSWTRLATSRSSAATSTKSSPVTTPSTPTSACCSTTSSRTAAGT